MCGENRSAVSLSTFSRSASFEQSHAAGLAPAAATTPTVSRPVMPVVAAATAVAAEPVPLMQSAEAWAMTPAMYRSVAATAHVAAIRTTQQVGARARTPAMYRSMTATARATPRRPAALPVAGLGH